MTGVGGVRGALELPSDHVHVVHGAARSGRVTVAVRCGRWREQTIALKDLGHYVENIARGYDTYVSQARFLGTRCIAGLVSTNSLWVDFDFYKAEDAASQAAALGGVLQRCEDAMLPIPSYVLGTGRGLCAVWLHDILPRQALPRWRAAQRAMFDGWRGLYGADAAALDAARVLRLAGTLNTRARPMTQVRSLFPLNGSPEVYDFEEIAAAVLPKSREEARRGGRRKEGLRYDWTQAKTAGTLWARRLDDLQRLRAMRWMGPLPEGQRDVWLFLASCAMSWMAEPRHIAREVRMLAGEALGGAWAEKDVDRQMGSVVARAKRAGRGGRITWQGHTIDPRYRFRTETIVDWLGITNEESRELSTLIDKEEWMRRLKLRQAARGRRSGAARRKAAEARNAEIAALAGGGKGVRAIARALGVPKSTVSRVVRSRAPQG